MLTEFCTLSSTPSQTARNVRVIFDNSIKFDTQIGNVKISFFQLRLLAKVKSFMTRHDLEKATHTLISLRRDYCNALYASVSQSSLSCLLMQNADARFFNLH